MRTNIDIDKNLLIQAMKASQTATKRAAVEVALQLAVTLKKQEDIRSLFGTVQWDGDLDAMRQGRVLDWEVERSGQEGQDSAKSGSASGKAKNPSGIAGMNLPARSKADA
ncbi:MAG TPA: type II toxin-antitoxin system VapB family antitoxin [Acidobacteriaceae bacterium]|jgi:Arc/MetJ family transcription regulator|nr:type II toxin-antitoxin system VapB family antitoxin [Acidobacteriaceae bacterium]